MIDPDADNLAAAFREFLAVHVAQDDPDAEPLASLLDRAALIVTDAPEETLSRRGVQAALLERLRSTRGPL
ncbi:hypothetical protein [Demequina salsinemoris]|uniref:hypothetical protein n=1 Tax=Demequina salsinemoris TaxID=577470 RepID=UPI0007808440|nr:hypothetical protein [Demequina salsinemoris]